ncbi:hypothetical protein DXG03_007582 [Asterophora parasitica]|uniref:Uncharacterized protein n=1 Tax=Asterophora parasitica TaxID=117018 RepID=A0A9P7G6D2_9AGAR|nr:hypothetical protein DXG03_007582 [Asterophora parasitica]
MSPARVNQRLSLIDRRPLRSSPLARHALSNPTILDSPEPPRTPPSDRSYLSPKRFSLRNPHEYPSYTPLDAPLSASVLPELHYGSPPRGRSDFTSPRPPASTSTPHPIMSHASRGSDRASPLPVHIRRASTPNNWLTTNTYDTTPRFSRLGISASSVVLPVSAREYKRVAAKKTGPPPTNTSGSFRASTLASFSVPSLMSNASSSETFTVSSSANVATSITSTSDVETVMDDSEDEDAPDIGVGDELPPKKVYPFIEIPPELTRNRYHSESFVDPLTAREGRVEIEVTLPGPHDPHSNGTSQSKKRGDTRDVVARLLRKLARAGKRGT